MSVYKLEYLNGLIIVQAKIVGKKDTDFLEIKLGLDTGSDRTIIVPPYIRAIGYQEKDKVRNLKITTGSKTDSAYELKIIQLEALGHTFKNPKIIVKEFPIALSYLDGLLGLDFFQKIGKKLTIDFAKNEIEII